MSKKTPEILISENLQHIAKELEKELTFWAGQSMCFTLLVYNTTPGARMNYISNTDKGDCIKAMRSLLDGWEEGMVDIPAHEVH